MTDIPLIDNRSIIDRRIDEIEARLAESMYGCGPEERVRQLRASILGETVEPPKSFMGLLAALDSKRVYGK